MKFQPLKAARTLFGYDAVSSKKRRRAAPASIKSEDKELNKSNRKTLISNTRDTQRNHSIASWMVRKHLDYVSSFKFRAKTGIPELDKRLEELMTWWSRPQNCDISGRHGLDRFIRLGEAHRTLDGDVGILKLRNGRIQAIEGDRIATPISGLPDSIKKLNPEHGVILNTFGAADRYIINKRDNKMGGSSLAFERTVQARNMILHGYFKRFDQFRGITPLAPVLNAMQDVHETLEYQNMKAKIHSMFGLAFRREGDGTDFDYDEQDVTTNIDGVATTTQRYDFKMRDGATKVELEPGDSIETFESKTPSIEFQDYTVLMIQLILLGLDIPLTFFDSKKSSYSANRQDLLLYMESAKIKRKENKEYVLDDLTAWKVGQWAAQPRLETNGEPRRNSNGDPERMLVLPAGMLPRDVKWEWQGIGLPWIDPLKEVNAHGKSIALGLKSRQQISSESGLDFKTTIKELKEEEEMIVDAGITVQVADPGATTTRDEETDNPANNSGDEPPKSEDDNEQETS